MEKELKFDEFEGHSKAEWVEKVVADLKGKKYESLFFNTDDDLVFEPFYTREEITTPEFTLSPASWNIRQDFVGASFEKVNKQILEALNGGVDSVGVFSVFKGDLGNLLKEVQVDYINLHVIGYLFPEIIIELTELYKNPKEARGTLDNTPLFNSYQEVDELDDRFWETFALSLEKLTQFKTIQVDVSSVLNNGGTTTQEIGIALAQGHEYMVALLEKNIPLKTIAEQIHFKFAIGSSYFVEIAKTRAFRWAWNQLLSSYLPEGEEMDFPPTFIYAETSTWNKSVKDVYNNMLRSTTEAMSAVLGGADSISVLPFDMLFAEENDFSLRMARNTLNIIKDEAYLEAVQDVAGGSYYIETLTNSFAHSGWEYFKKIEQQGGAIASINNGWLPEQINEEQQKKKTAFAQGEKTLLGVNKHPNKDEKIREVREDINRLEKTDA